MTTVGGVAGSIPATPQPTALRKPPWHRRAADSVRRNEETRLADRGLGGRDAAAGRAGLRGHRAGLQGLAGASGSTAGTSSTAGPGPTAPAPTPHPSPPTACTTCRGRSSAPGRSSGAPWSRRVIAIVIAVPLSHRRRLRAHRAHADAGSRGRSGFTIEILAGIPSVVIGLWGILTFGPWLAKYIYPTIANNMPDVPGAALLREPARQRRGPAHGGHRALLDDRPDHRVDHPRPVLAGAAAAQGGRVRARA